MTAAKQIQHLYNRAGFGLSPQEWQERKNWPIEKAVKELFDKKNAPIAVKVSMPDRSKEMGSTAKMERQARERELVRQQNIEWIGRMSNPLENALLERMCLFWHGHFACETKFAYLAAQQVNSIRQHALGNFRGLVLAIAKDPSMIRYLNNQQNRKRKPNENFARELMELFTIGRGNYMEKDIKEAARAFTGWSADQNGEFFFKEKHHDFGEKTFMGNTGNFNGEDIIDLILEKQETAVFITRKIYRYFVNEKMDEQRVTDLAKPFFIAPIMTSGS